LQRRPRVIIKSAAIYGQGFHDPIFLDAVDDVENLSAGFSRKIWQKITILENLGRAIQSGDTAVLRRQRGEVE
jgi:hypothetical protein